jgi:hypothetical protein
MPAAARSTLATRERVARASRRATRAPAQRRCHPRVVASPQPREHEFVVNENRHRNAGSMKKDRRDRSVARVVTLDRRATLGERRA